MFPEFLGNENGLVFNLHAGRIYPQEISLVRICLEAESIPEPQCGRRDQVNKISSMTPSVKEPTTFRLVAQWLN